MSGVIIQAEKVYSDMSVFGATVLAALFATAMFALIYATVSEFKEKASGRWSTLLLSVLFLLFGAVVCRGSFDAVNTIHTDLIVTVDDTVGFNEFNDRYMILSRNGDLYTVRELPIEYVEAGDNE